jgi:hypothetical protein
LLVEPESAEALADGIWQLWNNAARRAEIARLQSIDVEEYGMLGVARRFLSEVERTTGVGSAVCSR